MLATELLFELPANEQLVEMTDFRTISVVVENYAAKWDVEDWTIGYDEGENHELKLLEIKPL
jgi:hypothetical protein